MAKREMGAHRKYSMSPNQMPPWIDQHPTVRRYLKAVHGRTNECAQCIYLYSEWAKKSPEELLAMKNSLDSPADQLIDDFNLDEHTNIPDVTKFKIIYIVKGFYRVNRRQLQADAGKMEYHTKQQTGFPTKTECKLLYENAPPRTKPLIMLATTTAIAADTMSNLRWSHFEPGWEDQETPHISIGAEILKGHGYGRYQSIRQETFTTSEGKRALLAYREWYSETYDHAWKPDDYVFALTKHEIGKRCTDFILQQAVKEVSDITKVKFHIHDGRRRVQTALESVGCSPNWVRVLKGRKVFGSESPYSKPAIDQLREYYQKALPELEFLTSPVESEEQKHQMVELEERMNFLEGAIKDIRTLREMEDKK